MSEIVIRGQLFSDESVRAIVKELVVPLLAQELVREFSRNGEVSTAAKRNLSQTGSKNAMPQLLSVIQASSRLGIKPVTLRSWISERKIESVKLGRCVRVRSEVVDSFIERNAIHQITRRL